MIDYDKIEQELERMLKVVSSEEEYKPVICNREFCENFGNRNICKTYQYYCCHFYGIRRSEDDNVQM